MGNLEQRESDGEERGIGFDDDALSEVGETENWYGERAIFFRTCCYRLTFFSPFYAPLSAV